MKQVSSNKKKKELGITMSDKNLPTNINANDNDNLPAYLQKHIQDKPPVGLEQLKQYWTPDRVKIVQAQSGDKFKQFPVGSVVLIPQMMKIADPGQPFWITPIFTFTEFCVWNPYGLKGQLPTIRERTFDPKSEIAYKSRSKDLYAICPDLPPNLKNKKEDQNYMLRYCEHINHICVLRWNNRFQDHPANKHVNIPIIFSFHHSGFYEGRALSTLIMNRRVDIYAGQYELSTADRTNSKGTWKGFNITNPSHESGFKGFVEDEKDYLLYKGLYEDLQSKFIEGEIYSGDYDEDLTDEAAADETKKF